MKYLFILGRNIELSVAEIFSFLKKEGINILNNELDGNGFLLELEKELPKNVINSFGGVISIGKVLCNSDKKSLDKQQLYSGVKNNINYAVWGFTKEIVYEEVLDYLKNRFKEEKLKASKKNLTGQLELQSGKMVSIVGSLVDEEYFVFGNSFGKIIEKTNYKELEFRDIEKPHKRESLAISPRLAKIMLNLSEVKRGQTIVDPFCGIGVILIEALLQEIKVMGIDKDKEAIEMANKNLQWLKFKKENYKLYNEDSSKIVFSNCDALVTEPDFGEILNVSPSKEKAKEMVENYEKLIIKVLKNMKKYVGGRFVFTAPYILTNKGRISCNIENIMRGVGFTKLLANFEDYRKNQIVGRQIIVLGK